MLLMEKGEQIRQICPFCLRPTQERIQLAGLVGKLPARGKALRLQKDMGIKRKTTCNFLLFTAKTTQLVKHLHRFTFDTHNIYIQMQSYTHTHAHTHTRTGKDDFPRREASMHRFRRRFCKFSTAYHHLFRTTDQAQSFRMSTKAAEASSNAKRTIILKTTKY